MPHSLPANQASTALEAGEMAPSMHEPGGNTGELNRFPLNGRWHAGCNTLSTCIPFCRRLGALQTSEIGGEYDDQD